MMRAYKSMQMTNSSGSSLNAEGSNGHLRSQLTAKIVCDRMDQQIAYGLRYKAYVHAGYLEASQKHCFSDIYDERESSKTILIHRDKLPVGTARLCLSDRARQPIPDLPATKMFADEMHHVLESQKSTNRIERAVEITRLAREPSCLHDKRISFALFRMIGYLILGCSADVVFVAVTRNHIPFYRRLGYQMLCPLKDYPGLDVQTGLMACFQADYSNVQKRVPMLGNLSTSDQTYTDLMAGLEVDAFPQALADRPRFDTNPEMR